MKNGVLRAMLCVVIGCIVFTPAYGMKRTHVSTEKPMDQTLSCDIGGVPIHRDVMLLIIAFLYPYERNIVCRVCKQWYTWACKQGADTLVDQSTMPLGIKDRVL